jgi:hypothetical protein
MQHKREMVTAVATMADGKDISDIKVVENIK